MKKHYDNNKKFGSTEFFQNNPDNILMEDISVPLVRGNDKEGVDYINVSKYSESELGKMLSYGYPVKVKTVFGKLGTVRAGMDFIKTPGYPTALLGKQRLTADEVNSIPRKSTSVPNYWAIVAYIMCERIDQDSKVKKLLKENVAPIFTSFNTQDDRQFFKTTVKLSVPNMKMGRYLSIIRHIEKMLKEDRFTRDDIEQFVNDCKDHPELDIFEKSTLMMAESEVKEPVAGANSLPDEAPASLEEMPANDGSVLEFDEQTDDGHVTHVTEINPENTDAPTGEAPAEGTQN